MGGLALAHPKRVSVNRSDLRANQRAILGQAEGSTVVVVTANDEGEEKIVADKEYFESVLRSLEALKETLAITMDKELFGRILAVADTLDEDIRLGRLLSHEDVFGDD